MPNPPVPPEIQTLLDHLLSIWEPWPSDDLVARPMTTVHELVNGIVDRLRSLGAERATEIVAWLLDSVAAEDPTTPRQLLGEASSATKSQARRHTRHSLLLKLCARIDDRLGQDAAFLLWCGCDRIDPSSFFACIAPLNRIDDVDGEALAELKAVDGTHRLLSKWALKSLSASTPSPPQRARPSRWVRWPSAAARPYCSKQRISGVLAQIVVPSVQPSAVTTLYPLSPSPEVLVHPLQLFADGEPYRSVPVQ